jgi:hypothetical protein
MHLGGDRPSPDKVCVSLNEHFFSTTSSCQCRLRLFERQGDRHDERAKDNPFR